MSIPIKNEPSCTLEFRNGRPVILHEGEVVPPAIYCDCILFNGPDWIERNRDFVESGVHVYFLTEKQDWKNTVTPYWVDDGVYPEPDDDTFCLKKEAEAILAMDPDAKFFVRFQDFLPIKWQEKYPDELQQSSDGSRQPQLSLASKWGQQHLFRYMRHVMSYCEAQPWASKVVGYVYFPYGEGLTLLSITGAFFDVSPGMQRAFKEYVCEKYAGEEELRAAWNDPEITFDAVAVPREDEFKAKREKALHWPEPSFLRKEKDYFALQGKLFKEYYHSVLQLMEEETANRPVLYGVDAFKQPMFGWTIKQAFSSETTSENTMGDFPNMFLATGALNIADILDEGWNCMVTPADYTLRSVGSGWESEGINDSLRLRNKCVIVENDARTWVGGESETLGAFLTPEEVRAGLMRNTAWALSRGHLHYWMNIGSHFFHDPKVHEVSIRDERRILEASVNWPHIETEHAICMVVDDTSPLHENGTAGYQNLALIWQRVLGLCHSGLPYRIYLLSDLLHQNMPSYRTYIFPNLFEMNEERMDLLKQTVLRDGKVAIFGPSTGITDGTKLTTEWISRLMDVEFQKQDIQSARRVLVHGRHQITRPLPGSLLYGDSFPYGPILVPTREAVNKGDFTTLGSAATCWRVNKPGLIMKEFGKGAAGNGTAGERGEGDYAAIWSIAIPLPANLLRECARYAGSHIWCEEDDVVLASETIAAIHTVKEGQRTLKLPSKRPVWDLLSSEYLGELEQIEMTITAPETRLFYTGTAKPW